MLPLPSKDDAPRDAAVPAFDAGVYRDLQLLPSQRQTDGRVGSLRLLCCIDAIR